MPRVKNSVAHHKRVKKVLKAVKGYRGKRGKLYRVAKDANMYALKQAYIQRKRKKRTFRQLWIIRINAFVRNHGWTYSQFIHALKKQNIDLNRKTLSNMCIEDSSALTYLFEKLVKKASV